MENCQIEKQRGQILQRNETSESCGDRDGRDYLYLFTRIIFYIEMGTTK